MKLRPLQYLAARRRRRGPSALCFTVPKAGSTYLKQIIERLAPASGLTCVDYAAQHWESGFSDFESLEYLPVGHCYGPLRRFVEVPQIERFRILLHLRDPRDVLTSNYYSIAYSHKIANERLSRERERALTMDIDEYALDQAPKRCERYLRYAQTLLGRPNVLHVTYEDMVLRFDHWLDAVTSHLDLHDPKGVRDLCANHVSSVDQEDQNKHIRQITPGDHARKLKPQTIEQINEVLREVLDVFGYPLNVEAPAPGAIVAPAG